MSYQFDSRIATCSSESWMTNSLGQSPCQVGTVLALRACGQDRYYLGTLNPPDYAYADVAAEDATPCRCNTVSFMLISACAICQSGQNADWMSYSRNCWGTVTQPSQGVYPGTLPSGIAVPAWAYWVSGRPNFQFSTAIAKDFAGPDSTRPGSSPSTSTTPPSSTSTEAAGTTTTTSGTASTTGTSSGTSSTTSGNGTSTTGTSTGTTGTSSGASGSTATGDDVAIPSDAPQQGNSGSNTTGGSDHAQGTSRSTNVGAIAGGVVGGVIALLLLGLLAICLLRRRRARANLREDHPETSAVQGGGGGVAIDAGPAYDDSELPPEYAAVYGGDSLTTDGVDSIEEAGSADAQAASTSQLVPAGSSTSKFPDPYAPIPSRRIQSVHKSPLPLP